MSEYPASTTEVIQNKHGEFPLGSLLALSMASFVATANETFPAGLLPQIADGFHVSEAWAGQLVTFCALGSGLAAIPLTAMTRGWGRRSVLLAVLGGFAVCNLVTALSTSFALTLAARFLVGMATGLAWSLLVTYARSLVEPLRQGRALAVASIPGGRPDAAVERADHRLVGQPLFLSPRQPWIDLDPGAGFPHFPLRFRAIHLLIIKNPSQNPFPSQP